MKELSMHKLFIKYVALNVLGMLGISCYILADTFFVARGIGADGLTALNLAIPIYSFMSGVGLMIGMGGATRFAISKRGGVFTQAAYYGGILAALFFLAGLFFAGSLATALGADGATHAMTAVYLKVILCFSPMFILNNIVICFVRNDGEPKLAMLAMVLGSLFNIVFDYIFIFWCDMGMFGAALATGISPIISLLVLSRHFFKGSCNFKLTKVRPAGTAFWDMSRLGVSSLVSEVSAGVVMIVFNTIILGLQGNVGVAAYGVLANIALVVVAIFNGIAQGMQPIVSSYYGEGRLPSARKILQYGMLTAAAFALVVYGLFFLLADPVVALFNKDADPQLARLAVDGLRLYFTAFGFAGINVICAAYCSAVDRPKQAFWISMLRGFVLIIPVTFILSKALGITGVWLAMTVAEGLVLPMAMMWGIGKKTQ